MNDKDALKILLASLLIFTEAQQLFSDEFWAEMTDFQAQGALCNWPDIQKFYDRLKEFALQKLEVQQ